MTQAELLRAIDGIRARIARGENCAYTFILAYPPAQTPTTLHLLLSVGSDGKPLLADHQTAVAAARLALSATSPPKP